MKPDTPKAGANEQRASLPVLDAAPIDQLAGLAQQQPQNDLGWVEGQVAVAEAEDLEDTEDVQVCA